MSVRRYVQPKANDLGAQRQKESGDNTITQINNCPFITGQQLVVDLIIGSVKVYHKLGYVPKGNILLNAEGFHDYYMSSTLNTKDYVTFNSSIAVRITVWLF